MEQKNNKEKFNKIITVILVGLLLLIVVVPMGEDNGKVEDNQSYEQMANVSDEAYYEERLKCILEKSYGAGTMEVMVHMKEVEDTNGMYQEGKLLVDGILIVADVNSDTDVADISFAVCALFDLPAHKVAVIKK